MTDYIKRLIDEKGIRKAYNEIKRNEELFKEIKNLFPEIPDFKAKIYLLYHNLKPDDIVCKVCGKQIKEFIKFSKGFKKVCSKECHNKLVSITNKNNSKERVKKIKKTLKEKYGDENYNLKRAEERLLEKYGGMPFQNEEILKKTRLSLKEKYGVETPFHSKEIQDKIKFNNLKKYGVENYSKTEEAKNKISEKRKKEYLNKIKSNGYEILDEFYRVKKKEYKFKHLKCGTIFVDRVETRMPRCPKCFPSNISNVETEVREFLSDLQVEFITNSRQIIKPYEIDIFIPEKKLGIEINGLYWYSENSGGKDRKYHFNKAQMIFDLGIKYFQFYDVDWFKKNELIKSMIKSKLGIYDRKIYARKCEVREIDNKTKNEFLEENHYQGKDTSTLNIGLYYEDELVSVMTFLIKKDENYLSRFASKMNTQILGGFSKLLSYAETKLKGKITTHADRRYSNGDVYLKNGFKIVKLNNESYYYTDYKSIYHKFGFKKQKIQKKMLKFDDKLTEWENMQLNGYDRIWDCGKIKFEKEIKNEKE